MMDKHSPKRTLITGASGSGGSYIAEYIINNHPGVEVHGISRWHSTASHRNLENIAGQVEMHECDLADLSSVIRTYNQIKPDTVFHIASHANVRASWDNPLAVLQNNIMGTANLFEAIRNGGQKPVIQLCSTSEVYGQVKPENIPIKETHSTDPVNVYAISKKAQDDLGRVYHQAFGIPVVTTRMFAYLNPRRTDLFATSFAMQIARIEEGLQEELLHGNLKSTRTIIDVRDAMESYWVAATRGKPGEVYNIGGNTVITVGDFLDLLKKESKCQIPSREDPKLLRPIDVTLQIPDVTKFKRDTGWEPKYSIRDSVAYLLDHCRGEARREKLVKSSR